MNPNCTRELKEYPIKSYIKSAGIKKYKLAIGIRADEMDRLGKYWYPLAEWNITKPHVNFFWAKQPFRLNLKTYEGNCVWCWKKSLRKHLTLLNERPEFYEFPKEMETKYENYDPRNSGATPMRFFRNYLSIEDLVGMAKNFKDFAKDESKNYNYQASIWDNYDLDVSNGCTESCEPFK
jgi:hypothetical protein